MLEDPALSPHLRLPVVPVAPVNRVGEDATIHNVWESQGWWNHVVQGAERVVEAPIDSRVIKDFGRNGRDIVLSLNIDGFQPWKRVSYSMTPFVFMILNLPENLRHRAEYLLLAALMPGPKKLPLQLFLDFIVDELDDLYKTGIEILDPTVLPPLSQVLTVRVKLLFTCADYPAHSDINMQQGAMATKGCHKCHIEVSSCPIRTVQSDSKPAGTYSRSVLLVLDRVTMISTACASATIMNWLMTSAPISADTSTAVWTER